MRKLTQPAAIKRRILRITAESGPRSMNILLVLAGGNQAVLDKMVRDGDLMKFSDRRHAKYGATRIFHKFELPAAVKRRIRRVVHGRG